MRIIVFLFFFSSGAHAWSLFGPNNYDDCILANIKDAQNPQAVLVVKNACRSKFPMSDAEACEDLEVYLENIPGQGLTFAQARQVPGSENLSDDEIIMHAQSAGLDLKKLIAEKRCKDLYKNTK
jgi:hypothetical protein